MIYVSCCNHFGGLYKITDTITERLVNGNSRGLCLKDNSLVYGNNQAVYNQDKSLILRLEPDTTKCDLHDVKFEPERRRFYYMDTSGHWLKEFNEIGTITWEKKLSDNFHTNCCLPVGQRDLILFLSRKKGQQPAKIVRLKDDAFLWEHTFMRTPPAEIHSPVIREDRLYYCVSNSNAVESAQLDENGLSDFRLECLINDGYTRGLYMDDKHMLVGTSTNRHHGKDNLVCNHKQARVHLYHRYDDNWDLQRQWDLPSLEVYDIIDVPSEP